MIWHTRKIAVSAVLLLTTTYATAEIQQYKLTGSTLEIDTNTKDFTVKALDNLSFQVTSLTDDSGTAYANLPSMALPENSDGLIKAPEVIESATSITLKNDV